MADKTFGSEYTFESGFSVSPSDSTILGPCKALWIGTSGDVVVTTKDGTDLTFKNVPVGWFECASPQKVKAATTAADIVAVY